MALLSNFLVLSILAKSISKSSGNAFSKLTKTNFQSVISFLELGISTLFSVVGGKLGWLICICSQGFDFVLCQITKAIRSTIPSHHSSFSFFLHIFRHLFLRFLSLYYLIFPKSYVFFVLK